MSIVTRTGDQGTTGLFGGQRISKSSPRLHAYGTVDELNAVVGLVLAEPGLPATLRGPLEQTQRMLFRVGADLATPEDAQNTRPVRIEPKDAHEAEQWIKALESTLPVLKRFILPSGSRVSALLHHARTICRRAERWVVALSEQEQLNPEIQIYLNRLGDYLFLAARQANREARAEEVEVIVD
jgi:cob(I)alamin adenosyltransferase